MNRTRLRARLALVAAQPAEWVYGEYDDDINSVAAPVRDASGSVVAAVHVHGPAYRFPGNDDPDAIAARASPRPPPASVTSSPAWCRHS